ncbi:MAG TPA: hypothetical protein VNE39_06940 [Planctomycetota bacterium]|nr:hypothetical protein [Planctomycetota bacterium]
MGEVPLDVDFPGQIAASKAAAGERPARHAPELAEPAPAGGELTLEPPTWLGRVMRGLSFAVDATCRLRGGLWRLTPWRCRREAAGFAALCDTTRFATLREYPHLARAIEAEIRPHYELYTSRFNAAWMAVSLELSVFLMALCRLLKPRRLVDLGSGFSSVLLRLYQREAMPAPEVWSVDTSPEWLEMTRQILQWLDLPTDHLATWDDFVGQEPSGFDLVVHDLGSILTRRRTLRRVLGFTARGGVVVIDDANYGKVRRHAKRTLRKRGIEHHLVGAATRDKYGRYALLAAL